MPKRIPVETKRVPLNCLVLPETLAFLKAGPISQGVAVDKAVAALKTQAIRNFAQAFKKPQSPRPFKAPLLKPSQKAKK